MKVLITGGTNGIGKGVAKVLAGLDNLSHEVIILCRSRELGMATTEELKAVTGNNKISIVLCDLTKLSDVRNAIIEIHNRHEYLDGLFINAGLGYAAKRIETEDGMDSHFQVNYLSQFMLTLNLLSLLEKSENGGRIIFNVTKGGAIFWDDLQMKKKWGYVNGIHQAMVAKRMFYRKLHNLYKQEKRPEVSFIGFHIAKTVWSNQINIIPPFLKMMATVMKFLGTFITIEQIGIIMAPMLTENKEEIKNKSGKFLTWKKNKFIEIDDDKLVLNQELQDRLWRTSLELCRDEKTNQIAQSIFK